MAERRIVYSEEKGRRKVYSGVADDAKSVRHPYNDRTPGQSDFDVADFISMPMDPNETLAEGQHLSLAEIAKTRNLPY